MKIKTTNAPRFEHNGIMYNVDTCMYPSFLEFEKFLIEKNPSYVYIYSITNVGLDDKLIHPCNGFDSVDESISLIFIRFKMIKNKI